MAWLKRNLPPTYDPNKPYTDPENFDEFLEWGLSLKRPFKQLPEIADDLGFGMRVHPIGFIALYLSPRDRRQSRGLPPDDDAAGTIGCARVNIYLPGKTLKEDIHCHGFDFRSGVIAGTLINTMHHLGEDLPEGEGYIGYETMRDYRGVNHTEQVTDATVGIVSDAPMELEPGQTYSMRRQLDFHSVSAPAEQGAITFFSKTQTLLRSEGVSLVLKKPDESPPPESY